MIYRWSCCHGDSLSARNTKDRSQSAVRIIIIIIKDTLIILDVYIKEDIGV